MKGYLYVADEAGDEIEGSRRYLDRCRNLEELDAVRRQLERVAREGCTVLDSEVDRLGD